MFRDLQRRLTCCWVTCCSVSKVVPARTMAATLRSGAQLLLHSRLFHKAFGLPCCLAVAWSRRGNTTPQLQDLPHHRARISDSVVLFGVDLDCGHSNRNSRSAIIGHSRERCRHPIGPSGTTSWVKTICRYRTANRTRVQSKPPWELDQGSYHRSNTDGSHLQRVGCLDRIACSRFDRITCRCDADGAPAWACTR